MNDQTKFLSYKNTVTIPYKFQDRKTLFIELGLLLAYKHLDWLFYG